MSIELWLAFVAASAVLLAIPGPTVLLVISYALGHGKRSATATVAGVALGDFTAMTASMLGLGALLATSATLLTVMKWVGAAYLIYLGVKLWRARGSEQRSAQRSRFGRKGAFATHFSTHLCCHRSQSEKHHLLCGVPAAVLEPCTACRVPDGRFRGDIPHAGNGQRRRLWPHGLDGAQDNPQA